MNISFKAYLAEFIGTFALIFIGCGAILTNAFTNGSVGLVGIALAHGLTIAAMVSALGHLSGGHFNPAVTLAALVAKKIAPGRAGGYVISQLLGAIAGAGLLKCCFQFAPQFLASTHIGTPSLASGVTLQQGILMEAILTFFLVFVVFGSAIDEKSAFKSIASFAIGMTVTLDIFVGGPLTGAAMNPARAFGPALVSGFWTAQYVYWIGPLLGGFIAGLVYSKLLLTKK